MARKAPGVTAGRAPSPGDAADPTPRDVVARLGGHVAPALGLDLASGDDETLGRWLLASALHDARQPVRATRAACEALRKADLFDVRSVAAASPLDVEAALQRAEADAAGDADARTAAPRGRDATRLASAAARLVRLARALVDGYDGSVERLASGADGLDELATRLARLAPGFGRAAVVRFLTPLRSRWHVASDLPSTPAVRAAAEDLGWADGADEVGTPGALARALAADAAGAATPGLADLEAALDALGRAACLRGRAARCPLGDECPRRRAAGT